MVHIEKLNVDSALRAKLGSALEKFRKAKELSSDSSKIINEGKSIVQKEQSIISSEKIKSKFNEFINHFMYSEYETS